VHVVQTKLIYIKLKLESVAKIDVYSYRRVPLVVLELFLGFMGH
jgi:hypothetical protein